MATKAQTLQMLRGIPVGTAEKSKWVKYGLRWMTREPIDIPETTCEAMSGQNDGAHSAGRTARRGSSTG